MGAKVSEFKHPVSGTHPKAAIYAVKRKPRKGPSLPCLRVNLDYRFMQKVPEPERLFWDTLTKKEPHLFGVFEQPRQPWIVLALDEDLQEFVDCSRQVGVWVFELESRMVKQVWVFNNRGDRFPITRPHRFVSDFMGAYLVDMGFRVSEPPSAAGAGEVVYPRVAGDPP